MIVFVQGPRACGLNGIFNREWDIRLINVFRAHIRKHRTVLHRVRRTLWWRSGLLDAAPEELRTTRQLMINWPRPHAAGRNHLGLRVDAQLAGIAIVVDVVRPVGRKEP